MATKYTKKEFMVNIQTLTSPFEQTGQVTQGQPAPNIAEQIQQITQKNKGIKPL